MSQLHLLTRPKRDNSLAKTSARGHPHAWREGVIPRAGLLPLSPEMGQNGGISVQAGNKGYRPALVGSLLDENRKCSQHIVNLGGT